MSIYKTYSPDQIDNLLSNFLISSWSYSKLNQFARNEKAFEMFYIYNIKGKSAASAIAGQAYHYALDQYFSAKKDGTILDLVSLEVFAFEYIGKVSNGFWKTQKTTPTIADCREKALKDTAALLKNFFSEIGKYVDEIKEIVEVEIYCDEWITVNGVDIPMPCHLKIDLVVNTNDGKLVIIDHKSKSKFSDEQELRLGIGPQAITYVIGYETKSGLSIDEIWFIENKISKNKDTGIPQVVPFKVKLDKDTRRLYECLLYEPLKRMLEAVQNPDYTYLINPSDNYVDMAELYNFWCTTMLAEVSDFDIEASKKDKIEKRLRKIRDASIGAINPKVVKEFQKNAAEFIQYDFSDKKMTQEEKIEHVLRSFGVLVKVAHKFDGYSSNTYLLEVSAGVKISSIHSHRLDIANALDVSAVRIASDLVVHGGKSYVSIEFAKKRERNLIFDPAALQGFKIPLGVDNYGNVIVWDLDNHSTTNVLVCGAAGSGKSVLVGSTIDFSAMSDADRIIIFDPKYEFTQHRSDRIEVYNEIMDIEEQMVSLVKEMNERVRTGVKKKTLVFFDEFADALSQARKGVELDIREMVEVGVYANGQTKEALRKTGEIKALEENLRVMLQKGRSTGYRFMCATQRASVRIIGGDAKVNFLVQICLRVPKEADSRVVIDEAGAESLAGMGDALMKSPEYKDTVRFQAYYKPSLVTA